MIERENTNELQGQYTLDDLLPGNGGNQAAQPMEGYDADGNLLNVDAIPEETPGTSSVTADAVPPSPKGMATHTPEGKAFGDDAPKESLPPVGKVGASDNACIVPTRSDEVPASPQTPADDEARLSALATEINAITEQTRGVVISAALAVGKRLIEARSLCQEGRWLEWLSKSVSYSERKAQDMMRLYVEYGRDGSIPDSIAALDYSKAVALLAAPADQREALAERAADDDLSVRQLQAEIKRLKEEAAKAQQTIEWHEDMKERLDNNFNKVENDLDEVERQLEAKDDELQAAKKIIAEAAEKVSLAQAKAAAAEASADELRKLHSDAEDRAAASAQRASDAVNRANQTAKQLAEAKAKIQALSEAAAAGVPEPEVRTVEVVPEAVQREIEQLRRELAEAQAFQKPSPDGEGGPRSGSDEVPSATAAEKFKWFYQNQMQPTFKQALALLKEVAQEDGHAADAFATAMTNACRVLMNQLGS